MPRSGTIAACRRIDVVGINELLSDAAAPMIVKIDVEGTEGSLLRAFEVGGGSDPFA
jgi:hypothetical protein